MPCDGKNPLVREGTSLMNRVLAALSTDFAKVDERDAPDLLLFAKRYAGYLNFYDASNAINGTWEDLMKMDVSVVLATLNKIDVTEISDYKKLLFKRIKQSADDTQAVRELKYLFDVQFSLTKMIDEQYNFLPEEFEYKNIIHDLIQNKLQQPLANLEKCFNDFKAAGLLDYSNHELDGTAPIPVTSDENFSRTFLSSVWQTAVADLNITLPSFADAKSTIVYITNHNLFNSQIESLLNGTASLLKHAETLFDQTIESFSKHSPHYALFISFVKLFRIAQDYLNTYTQRHLDFYYKEVLQLTNKAPEPDSVHLTFELQKPVDQNLLEKDSLFKGGKDITGKEIQYALTEDLVINKAVISKIQAWEKAKRENKDMVLASLVSNSDDGRGAKISSTDQSWFTFGDAKKAGTAKAGFAIASNLLYLNEGTRNIAITINFVDNISVLNSSGFDVSCFSASLTGKKDWHKIENLAAVFPSNSQMQLSINLSPDDPAIIPYLEKIHKEKIELALPILKIYLEGDIPNSIPYTLLCDKQISSVQIQVSVSGVKDLMLSNDNGSIDASKPFKPFGEFPEVGSGFYIGSKEIFQKQLTEISLNTEWKSTVPSLSGTANYLRQAGYSDGFTLSGNNIIFTSGNPFTKAAIDFTPNEILKATTLEGFLKIKNNSNFSEDVFLQAIGTSLSKTTLTQSGDTYSLHIEAPPSPTDVVLNSFSVDYTAEEIISFSDPVETDNNLFIHLTPFGYSQVHPDLFSENVTSVEKSERLTLIPNLIHEGELFLGFENAEPDTVVNVLFQVADGSSNPLKNMEELSWYYLSENNNWILFDNFAIVDNTKNFTQSGIVTFTFPKDISDQNTAYEKGLHWIKATVKQNTDAVCKMILIQAQAGRAELVQDDIKQIEFRQTLPSTTISKLVNSDPAIKKIIQPFDSFGGRTRESDEHFYVRVSERLRHKQRAINIWDYEHIILEEFPQICKAKCLNHSGFYFDNIAEVFCENMPGHVTIVTIPDFKNKTNINPLRPYTSIGLLTNINDYLKTIISPFVKLHVKNPQFEEIRLSFKVKFYDNLDVSFYQQLLNQEIEAFLCPWAWDNDVQISFGGKIIKSSLLNFVEERTYVDFVTCFQMDHIIEREGSIITKALIDIEEAEASTSRSVLVSWFDEDEKDVTKQRHLIDTTITCDC
jgi:hypothetical protein